MNKIWHLDLGFVVFDWLPVRNGTHAWFPIPKLLAERSILRVNTSTAMGIMEPNVQKERSEKDNFAIKFGSVIEVIWTYDIEWS